MRIKILIIAALVISLSSFAISQDTKENSDFKLAVKLFEDKLYDLAFEQFRQFISAYPNTQQGVEGRFYFGLCQLEMKKYEEARLTFQNFALTYAEHPKAPEAWLKVADACIALNLPREAALAYERVKTFHPRSRFAPDALLKASEYFEAAGDRENSRRMLRALTTDYGSSNIVSSARIRLAEMFLEEKEWEQARIEAVKAVEASQSAAEKAKANLIAAEALTELGKLHEAQKVLNEIISKYSSSPSYSKAIFALGVLHKELGNFQEAVLAWKTVSEDTVRIPLQLRQDALIELGEIYASAFDYVKALPYFERAAALRGNRTGEADLEAGIIAERSGQSAKAIDWYERALKDSIGKADPRAIIAAGQRGAIMADKSVEAVLLAEKYRSQFPRDKNLPKILFDAAEACRLTLKDYRKAIELDDYLLSEFPLSTYADDAFFAIGMSQKESGKLDDAERTFEVFINQFPASELIPDTKKQLKIIRTFELKSGEAGLNNLAMLMGDVIAQKSKGELAFRLGEIFFKDLKDYERAAEQYRVALSEGIESAHELEVWYRLAKSYEYINYKSQLSEGANSRTSAMEAIAAYDTLLIKFPVNEFYHDVVLSQYMLKINFASSLGEVKAIIDTLLVKHNAAKTKGAVLAAAASYFVSKKNYEEADSTLRKAIAIAVGEESIAELYYMLAKVRLEIGEEQSAYDEFDVLLKRYPKSGFVAEAASMLAAYYAKSKKTSDALALYDLLEKNYYYTPYASNLNMLKGKAYFISGQYKEAIEKYLLYIQEISSSLTGLEEIPKDVYYELGVSYDQLEQWKDAKKYYAEFLLRESSTERAGAVYYSFGIIARKENNFEIAARYLQESSRLGKSEGAINKASLESADLFFKTEKYSDAVARYAEIAQQAAGDSAMNYYTQSRLIECYYRLDNLKEAERRFESFKTKYSWKTDFISEFEYERGMYFWRHEELEKALAQFDQILNKYKSEKIIPEALYAMARVYEGMQNIERAGAIYDTIIKTFPDNQIIPHIQLSLGNLFYSMENWEQAAGLYNTILENEQRSPELVPYAMGNLIIVYKELGMYDAALRLSRKYIERFPDDPELINKRVDIGVLFTKLGYYEQAIMHLQSLLEGADADLEAEIRYDIGEAYFYKGDYQQAILEFLKIPYLSTRRTKVDWVSTAYYMAGKSYEKMSKFDFAITMYQQIIDRPAVESTFRTAAQKEIDRVRSLIKNEANQK